MAAAKSMSAIWAWSAPARTAETMQRSAPSASRTSTKRRNQPLSVARSAVPVGQRTHGEPRRLSGGVARDGREAVVEGARPVLGAR